MLIKKIKEKKEKQKAKAVRVTARDEEILNFVSKFGFCEMPQIREQFKMGRATCYHVLKRLVVAGYLIHDRVFFQRHGFYRVSKTGTASNLPLLNQVPLEHYNHHLTVLKVFQRLLDAHPQAAVTSERQLIVEKFDDGFGKRGHLSDGIMTLPDKCIAIEVELTKKAKGRLKKIFEQYLTSLNIQEVWYFCAPDLLKRTREMASGIHMIKIINIQEFLHDQSI